MRTYFGGLALLVAGFASDAGAQFQIIAPPHGGVPIVAGGYYTAGTVFANGMAYPNGTITQASYAVPVASYPSFGTGYYGGAYPQNSYSGYPSFGLGISFGNVGYGSNRGYAGYGLGTYPGYGVYGGYSSFGTGYGHGYSGNRGYGGGSSGSRGHNGGGGRRR